MLRRAPISPITEPPLLERLRESDYNLDAMLATTPAQWLIATTSATDLATTIKSSHTFVAEGYKRFYGGVGGAWIEAQKQLDNTDFIEAAGQETAPDDTLWRELERDTRDYCTDLSPKKLDQALGFGTKSDPFAALKGATNKTVALCRAAQAVGRPVSQEEDLQTAVLNERKKLARPVELAASGLAAGGMLTTIGAITLGTIRGNLSETTAVTQQPAWPETLNEEIVLSYLGTGIIIAAGVAYKTLKNRYAHRAAVKLLKKANATSE